MRQLLYTLLIFSLFTACTKSSSDNTETEASVSLGTLEGRLTQTDGSTAISGATLKVESTAGLSAQIYGAEGPLYAGAEGSTAETDSNGDFSITVELNRDNKVSVTDSGGSSLGSFTASMSADGKVSKTDTTSLSSSLLKNTSASTTVTLKCEAAGHATYPSCLQVNNLKSADVAELESFCTTRKGPDGSTQLSPTTAYSGCTTTAIGTCDFTVTSTTTGASADYAVKDYYYDGFGYSTAQTWCENDLNGTFSGF